MFRSYQKIDRRLTRVVKVGNVLIGGNNPIAVQTMTNTLTKDIKKTTNQILKVVKAGAELVRVSIPDKESADALKIISKKSPIPIIADIHFHYKRALEAAENGASCLRINPGNIGSNDKVKEVIKAAKNNDCSIRIGVNGGSLEKQILEKYSEPNPDALVESAVLNMQMLEDNDFNNFKISVKSSDIFMSIKAYEKLSSICDYPLHLGITEAGSKRTGSIKSSIGIGNLLLRGIGDTIRISLSDEPEEEVKVGFEILKSLGLRQRGINIISCPSCARQQFPVIETVKKLEKALEDVTNPLTVSIIGCVVNGPGEATMTQIGITGGGNNTHMIYIDGKKNHIVKNTELIPYLEKIIREKVKLNHTKDH
ncbi:MAG: 4-hydroxy-3-methylbut-2-en-1-yl diphosphate synthase [Rickettsiales bacterium]|nr:4-hydroxy-3-methylbut-2-en-1-yl diphosphate synthase [Rickettsiales bacterium]|tara:strand:+ start:3641 stop:4741 length:1101 start_codon:yes stop_codon:yes gene_type:complete